jgi:uncharacterized protein YecE (DUF72 family)
LPEYSCTWSHSNRTPDGHQARADSIGRIVAHLARMIHFGTAGWLYKDWEGIVYPAQKERGFDPLHYLARFFSTVEINSTFYGPAKPDTADKWISRVSDFPNFRFTAKLWKRFTHERGTAWTRAEAKEARGAFDRMMKADKLGAVLIQFPWSFRRTDENREWLDDVSRAFRAFPLALEVRHSSWNTPDFYESLADRGIGFVNIDQPLFHNSIKPSASVTSAVGYIRVHGRNYKDWFRKGAGVEARYDYLYSKEELKPWAKRAKEIASVAEETFVVTNNHYKGKAAANALMLKKLVTGRKSEAPPGLIEEYGAALKGMVKLG